MIEYLYTEGRNDVPIKVRFNGKVTGTIKPVEGGWQYFPLHHTQGGNVYKTVDEVQKSLEYCEEA